MESFIRLLMVSFAMDNLSLVKTRMLFVQLHSLKNNPHEVIDRIAKGVRSWVDVGVITVANGEHFINVADIHLSAKAGYYASRCKRFGKLCYVIGALQAFLSHQNQDLRLKILMMVSEKCTPKVLLELNPCLAKYSVFCGLNSALHFAAPKGHNEIVTLLLENGVVVNSRNYCRQIQFKYMIWCYHIWGDIMWKTDIVDSVTQREFLLYYFYGLMGCQISAVKSWPHGGQF